MERKEPAGNLGETVLARGLKGISKSSSAQEETFQEKKLGIPKKRDST